VRCERPYSGLSAEQTAVYVVTGGRLDCPRSSDCDEQVYAVMSSCWRRRAHCRPSAAALHRRLAALRAADDDQQRQRQTAPPPLPVRPSDSTTASQQQPARAVARRTLPRVSSQLSASETPPSGGNLLQRPRSLHLSASEELLQPVSRTDDLTSHTDAFRRNAAVRIRDSFRKFVSSRKSAPTMGSIPSPLASPTAPPADE